MKSTAVDHAVARFTEPMNTPAEKVTAANTYIAAIKASINWALPTAADLQAAVGFWITETANIAAGATLIASLEKKLAAARTAQLASLRRWGQRKTGVLNALDVLCDGSKDMMTTFGVGIAEAAAHVAAVVPVDLKSTKSMKSGIAGITWLGSPVNPTGFMVQHATSTTDPTTYSAPIPCPRRSFELPGQTPAATIYFRVAAQDSSLPAGQTAWTAWVAAVVSL